MGFSRVMNSISFSGNYKKGGWASGENKALQEIIDNNPDLLSTRDFSKIAKLAQDAGIRRDAMQIHTHWANCLDTCRIPDKEITPEIENQMMQCLQTIGNRWTEIAKILSSQRNDGLKFTAHQVIQHVYKNQRRQSLSEFRNVQQEKDKAESTTSSLEGSSTPVFAAPTKEIEEPHHVDTLIPEFINPDWTLEEDEAIKKAVNQYPGRWCVIQQKLGLQKTRKQIRARYVDHLDPNLVKDITSEMCQQILQLQQQHGNQWHKITEIVSSSLPNQQKISENAVKNCYYSDLNKKIRKQFNKRKTVTNPSLDSVQKASGIKQSSSQPSKKVRISKTSPWDILDLDFLDPKYPEDEPISSIRIENVKKTRKPRGPYKAHPKVSVEVGQKILELRKKYGSHWECIHKELCESCPPDQHISLPALCGWCYYQENIKKSKFLPSKESLTSNTYSWDVLKEELDLEYPEDAQIADKEQEDHTGIQPFGNFSDTSEIS